jgi:hypothetical protein
MRQHRIPISFGQVVSRATWAPLILVLPTTPQT